ncbi:MAG: ATP synthase F0 subunit B [bacterium]
MPRRIRSIIVLTAVLLPAAVFAATGEGSSTGRQLYDLVMRIINFAILLGALIYFLRKPARSFIENSVEAIRKLIKDAEETRKTAEAKMKEAEEKFAGLSRQVEELMEHAREESETEKARILSEAEKAVEKLKREASQAIQQELKKSQEELRNEVAQIAVTIAREIIRENIQEKDHTRFVEEYLEKLEVSQQ